MAKTDWRTRPVAGIGIVGLDHVAVTNQWKLDTKSTASHYFEQVGGPVPVALMAMAKLGLEQPLLFFGAIGKNDLASAVIRQELRKSHVEARWVGRKETPRSLVVLDNSDGTRTLTNYPGTSIDSALLPDRKPAKPFAQVGLLHIDGRESRWAKQIRELYGVVLSLDLGSPRPTHKELLPHCDIIIASKPGSAGTFPAVKSPLIQTKRFLELGATVAGVTLGAEGVIIGCRDENNGEPVHLPAFHVANVVDTCGAGDLFHGAFLWAYRTGKNVVESATFAQAAVALRIQHYGNVAGQPTREQVETFLGSKTLVSTGILNQP